VIQAERNTMTIPSIRTVHGIVRISVVVLILIAVIAGQARSSTPEPATNGSALSQPLPEPPADKDRRTADTSLMTVSVQLVLFGVDTFLEMHKQNVTDDRNAALDAKVPD
jgi:hypothetical protein